MDKSTFMNSNEYSRLSIESNVDMDFGVKIANGSFNGIVGKMQRNEFDIFSGPGTNNVERYEHIEEALVAVTEFRLVSWIPSKQVDPFNFVSAFDLDVWLITLMVLCFLPLICWTMARCIDNRKRGRRTSYFSFLWDAFMWLSSAGEIQRTNSWFRLCKAGFLLSMSVTFMSFLSSGLISTMTIPLVEDHIDGYEDVLKYRNVTLFVEKDSFHSNMYTKAASPLFKQLAGYIRLTTGIFQYGSNLREMMRQVVARKAVICGDTYLCRGLVIQFINDFGHCPAVRCSSGTAGMFTGGIFVSRHLSADVRDRIQYAVHVGRESHLFEKRLDWIARRLEECEALQKIAKAEARPLTLESVQGSFIVIGIGLTLSVAVFLIENILVRSTHFSIPVSYMYRASI